MFSLPSDVLYSLRTLRRNPGFAATVVISLALGIGACSAIFTLLDAFLFQSLPVRDREQLVQITTPFPQMIGSGSSRNYYSYPMFLDLRDRNQVLSALACRARSTSNFSYRGVSEQVNTELVSGDFFDMLGVRPAVGRLLLPRDADEVQSAPTAVLSYGYWKRRFGAQPNLVGEIALLNGRSFAIVGVADERFQGVVLGSPPEIYVPVTAAQFLFQHDPLRERRNTWLQLLGRLKEGVSPVQAEAALNSIFRQVLQDEVREVGPQYSEAIKQRFVQQTLELRPGRQGVDSLRHQLRLPLRILWAAVTSILLIACANAAALQLAQAARRRKEIAVRLALGASRKRLVQLLLTESLVLATLAGLAGLLLAAWMLAGLDAMVFAWIGRTEPLTLNLRVLGFTALISLVSALLFGLVPAWQATRTDLQSVLKSEGGTGAPSARARARSVLVTAQVALSVLLLAGAGLFLRTLLNLYRVELNFPRDKVFLVSLNPASNKYSPARSQALVEEFQERARNLPGVRNASLAQASILFPAGCSYFFVENNSEREGEDNFVCYNWVTPGYLASLDVPLLRGRDFTSADLHAPPRAAIVNEAFAHRFFRDQNPIGQRFGFLGPASKRDIEIIGVTHFLQRHDAPFMFLALNQEAFQFPVTLHLRFDGDSNALVAALRREMATLDAALPLHSIQTVETQLNRSVSSRRNFALLTGICGGIATLLAVVGLFGLLSFTVTCRSREIGIRMALGAERTDVVWLVARQTLLLTGIGIAIGISAALALTRLISSMLYEVRPNDPPTLLLAAVIFALIAFLAAVAPARRAAGIDPAATLRHE